MSLEDILAAIRADTDAEVAAVLARARDEVSAIEERARRDGEREAADIVRVAGEAASGEADRIVIRARSDVRRLVADAVETEYRVTLDRLGEELDRIRSTPRYREVLGMLLQEALERLPEASVVLVDPRDASLVTELLGDGDSLPRIDASLVTMGGVSVATDDGRRVRNTFEVRTQRADGVLRTIAAGHLSVEGSAS